MHLIILQIAIAIYLKYVTDTSIPALLYMIIYNYTIIVRIVQEGLTYPKAFD